MRKIAILLILCTVFSCLAACDVKEQEKLPDTQDTGTVENTDQETDYTEDNVPDADQTQTTPDTDKPVEDNNTAPDNSSNGGANTNTGSGENNTTTKKRCSQCGLSEPETVFTEDWEPGGKCFGCMREEVHEKKLCSECGADCTYRGLEEDGRCEDCYFADPPSDNDDTNNQTAKRTCPQCGLSEPDAIFNLDWVPGALCFGCSYDNFHGGEEAKKYCSECGADCTYRGLEEDGRCEDCYFGN